MVGGFFCGWKFKSKVEQIYIEHTVGTVGLSLVRQMDKNLILYDFLMGLSITLKSQLFVMRDLEVIKCLILVQYNNILN